MIWWIVGVLIGEAVVVATFGWIVGVSVGLALLALLVLMEVRSRRAMGNRLAAVYDRTGHTRSAGMPPWPPPPFHVPVFTSDVAPAPDPPSFAGGGGDFGGGGASGGWDGGSSGSGGDGGSGGGSND